MYVLVEVEPLEKGRNRSFSPHISQATMTFDEEAHPRLSAGGEKEGYKPGEFVPKGTNGANAAPKKAPWQVTREEFESGPDVVYHGGSGEYRIDASRQGASTGNPTSDFGAFFTPDRKEAERYVKDFHAGKGTVMAARLDLKNPYHMSFGEFDRIVEVEWNKLGFPEGMKELKDRVARIKTELLSDGHDGIIVGKPGKARPQEIIAFDNDSIVQHKYAVEEALARGEDVPAEVLADYPDFAPQRAAAPPEGAHPEPWTIGPDEYQRLAGVKQPWIAEISPMQYGMFSKRQKAAYDKKRDAEWSASMDIKSEWFHKVTDAYDAGTIDLKTPGLSPDAVDAIKRTLHVRKKQDEKAALEDAHKANQITSVDQVKVGDRVFDVMSSSYGTVTKINRNTVRFKPERPLYQGAPEEIKTGPGSLQWKKYDDVKAAPLEKGLLVKARRRSFSPHAAQGAMTFDEEAHPRLAPGEEKEGYRPGEFVPKRATATSAEEKPNSAVVAIFDNPEDGVRAHVAKVPTGFSVAVQDADSGEFLPVVNIYPTQERAEAEARKAVGLTEEAPADTAGGIDAELDNAEDQVKARVASALEGFDPDRYPQEFNEAVERLMAEKPQGRRKPLTRGQAAARIAREERLGATFADEDLSRWVATELGPRLDRLMDQPHGEEESARVRAIYEALANATKTLLHDKPALVHDLYMQQEDRAQAQAQPLEKARRRVEVSPGQGGLDFDAAGDEGTTAGPALFVTTGPKPPKITQGSLDFDAEHPRAPAGATGKYKGGEFIPKETAEAPPAADKPAEYREARAALKETQRTQNDVPSWATGDSLKPSASNYKYADTGHIAGSRKELAAERIKKLAKNGETVGVDDVDWEALEENPRQAAALITKQNVFGDVDIDEMEARGVDPGAAFLVTKLFNSVGAKPEDSPEARRNYVTGVEQLRARMEECSSVDDVLAAIKEIGENMDGERYTAEEQEAVAAGNQQRREIWDKLTEIRQTTDQIMREEISPNINKSWSLKYKIQDREKRGWKPDPKLAAELKAAEAARDAGYRKLDAYKVEAGEAGLEVMNKTVSALMRQLEEKGKKRNQEENPLYAGFHALGDKFKKHVFYRRYKGSDTFEGHVINARQGKIKDYSFARGERKIRAAGKSRIRFQLKVADKITREGGRPMKADSTIGLKNNFGLRDVQSGNYVLKDVEAAKFHTEHAGMALQDLADVLGCSDSDVGFRGRIALAFGARGKGGKDAAAAHWEPVHRVINITKFRGGGTLSHEWWHSFDNLVHEATSGEEGKADHFGTDHWEKLPTGPIRDAYQQLMKEIIGSNFHEEALKLDATEEKYYWAQPREMTARAFAAYVDDFLRERSRKNTYLTANNHNVNYSGIVHEDGTPVKPCPEGEERLRINRAFTTLFDAVKQGDALKKALDRLEKGGHDVSGEPRDELGRWTDEPGSTRVRPFPEAKEIRAEDIKAAKAALKAGRLHIHDVYPEKKAPREEKGQYEESGDVYFGYAYSPDLFERSDATGRFCRYYLVLGNGAKVHPDELSRATVNADGTVSIPVNEKIRVRVPGQKAQAQRKFYDAAWYAGNAYTSKDASPEEREKVNGALITIEGEDGRKITKRRDEWRRIADRIRPFKAGQATTTFQEFADQNGWDGDPTREAVEVVGTGVHEPVGLPTIATEPVDLTVSRDAGGLKLTVPARKRPSVAAERVRLERAGQKKLMLSLSRRNSTLEHA